ARDQASELETKVLVDGKQDEAKVVGVVDDQNNDEPNVFEGVPIFSIVRSCSACSRVFTGDIYKDHVVSCTGIIDIKHHHNIVRDTLVDICFWSGISTGKDVDIELGRGRDKPLLPADLLLYSWDRGHDVCVDLTWSSPLT
nr:hypothetical protein [Tanacetum cinerariifolium]